MVELQLLAACFACDFSSLEEEPSDFVCLLQEWLKSLPVHHAQFAFSFVQANWLYHHHHPLSSSIHRSFDFICWCVMVAHGLLPVNLVVPGMHGMELLFSLPKWGLHWTQRRYSLTRTSASTRSLKMLFTFACSSMFAISFATFAGLTRGLSRCGTGSLSLCRHDVVDETVQIE